MPAQPFDDGLSHLGFVGRFVEAVVSTIDEDDFDGVAFEGLHGVGVLWQDDIVGCAVDEEPGRGDRLGEWGDVADGLAEVAHELGGERAAFLLPHEPLVGRLLAEFSLGESFGVDHAGEGYKGIDALVFGGLKDADGTAHAVADVGNFWIRPRDRIEHRREVAHFFRNGGTTEVAFRIAVASEGEAQRVKSGGVERVGRIDDDGAFLITRHTVTEHYDPAVLLFRIDAGSEGVVECFVEEIFDELVHNEFFLTTKGTKNTKLMLRRTGFVFFVPFVVNILEGKPFNGGFRVSSEIRKYA